MLKSQMFGLSTYAVLTDEYMFAIVYSLNTKVHLNLCLLSFSICLAKYHLSFSTK